jgi:hypothetical protein
MTSVSDFSTFGLVLKALPGCSITRTGLFDGSPMERRRGHEEEGLGCCRRAYMTWGERDRCCSS